MARLQTIVAQRQRECCVLKITLLRQETLVNSTFPQAGMVGFPEAIPIGRYRLIFDRASGRLPGYPGSAWRGAFGRQLRRIACSMPGTDCKACPVATACAYPYLFETAPPLQAARMRLYQRVPVPYVLEPEETFLPADSCEKQYYELGLVLVGNANRNFPYVLEALRRAGTLGIGRNRVRLFLQAVQCEQPCGSNQWTSLDMEGVGEYDAMAAAGPAEVPAPPAQFTLRLLTPLRLIREGRLAGPERFRLGDFLVALVRRVASCAYFHAGIALPGNGYFRELAENARALRGYEAKLRWRDWTRYSTRQRTAMQMGGLVGHVDVRDAGIKPFWPFLWIGQWLHAGRGTAMGLGRYVIERDAGGAQEGQ
ncbi:MAG: CRISPR system precrRNA processing endoribonuclease RAMP protein Cas6 [Candidatus Dadabacteria bacterium]|nr:MAG: CRISPR system precrRNA processing endoribonuclease RAMP protein Cas6 [Candidatus Dadabacteria bacterium]